ncbi:protein kinase domain-containing protein [Gimesia sp.]|uniref:protein kinase domain-containing protein n=1 Tax=Gimesia sp. TaxID=2024833 RepID=UPI003A954474
MNSLNQILDQYEQLWQSGVQPQLDQFVESLALSQSDQRAVLSELIAVDLEYQSRLSATKQKPGTDPSASDFVTVTDNTSGIYTLDFYADRWPELFSNTDHCASLIAEEYRIRHRWGDQPQMEEYIQRYGDSAVLRRELEAVQRELALDSREATEKTSLFEPGQQAGKPPQLFPELPAHFGRYELLSLIGKGGMGEVYRARDTQLDREVALKLPRLDQSVPLLKERFLNEARTAATLRHPHICPIYDSGQIDSQLYLTMAYIEGQNLQELWAADSHHSLLDNLTLLMKVARAIQIAHNQQIIHRDLKPANIMVDSHAEPVVMDFGLAHRVVEGPSPRLTQAGDIVGSPAYMSPEQMESNTAPGPASDIYSLGVILFEALTGTLPFKGTLGQITAAVMRDAPPRPSTLQTDIDAELEALCLQMLQKSPEARPASMQEVAERLAAIQQRLTRSETIIRTKPSVSGNNHRRRNHKRTLIGAAGVAALFCMGIILTLATDKGTLIVRSEVPDISVLIKQGDKTVETLKVSQGTDSTTIYSGQYEIVLQGKNLDGLEVTPQVVKLSRNQTTVVTIERITDGTVTPGQIPSAGVSQEWLTQTQKLPGVEQFQAVIEKLQELNPGFEAHIGKNVYVSYLGGHPNQYVHLVNIDSNHLQDISPLQALQTLQTLSISGTQTRLSQFKDLSPLAAMNNLNYLTVRSHPQLTEIESLQNLKLKNLELSNTNVSDLSSLRKLPLERLDLNGTMVTDLSPLAEMKSLIALELRTTAVSDLSSLKGLPLTDLFLSHTSVSDLSPLEGMPLVNLDFSSTNVTDLTPLKSMPLEVLRLNSQISDLTPLQDFSLKELILNGSKVTDLTPLQGMPLEKLILGHCSDLQDLSPLQGMKLKHLNLVQTDVRDLSPLAAMPLEELHIDSPVSDISPLKNLRLKSLQLQSDELTDISPLKGMPLETLTLAYSRQLKDITPLSGMPLRRLGLANTSVQDLTPLKGIPLESLELPEDLKLTKENRDLLESVSTLKLINKHPVKSYIENNLPGQ